MISISNFSRTYEPYKRKPRIGVISPYRSNDKREHIENLMNARVWQVHQEIDGNIPVVPHLLFTGILDDDNPEERELGIRMGHELYSKCVYVEVNTWGRGVISEGMAADIEFCKANNIELRGEI